MIKYNIKLALRLFNKNRFYFFLNLTNLILGIICGIVILLYLQNYIGFDKHHKNYSRIFRVGYEFTTSTGKSMKWAKSSEKVGKMFKDECPEVESYVRVRSMNKVIVKCHNKSFTENNFFYADTNIFNVFTHEFIEGDAQNCFRKQNSVVLTNHLAKKIFGKRSPIGEIIKIDTINYEVTGVIKDLPDNVHFKFDALINYKELGYGWFTANCYTYLLLKKNTDKEGIYKKYPQLFQKYMLEQSKRIKAKIDIVLEPLAEIHFHSGLSQDFPKGNITYVYILGLVGLFVVVITSINYINMATAFSINRIKEVGIKKVFGINSRRLFGYFLYESILITMIAFLISVFVVKLVVNSEWLFRILNARLQFGIFKTPVLFLITLGFALLVGLFSGLYPSIRISKIPALGASSHNFIYKKRSTLLRKALIVFQFFLSIGVMIGVLAMNKQMKYIQNKDLGYKKENLIIIPLENIDNSKLSVLKAKLGANPNIISTSSAYILPNSNEMMCNFRVEGASGFVEQLFNWLVVDYDYFKTMDMQIIEGRTFNKDIPSDLNMAYIVNKSFLKHFGWNSAAGKRMQIINGGYFKWPEGKIIGVVKDFNISSLHKEIEPMIIVLLPGGYLHVRISGTNIKNTLEEIQAIWSEVVPETDFNYSFMDEHLTESYNTEINQVSLVKLFSVICFLLSCLGLIGLSAYIVAQRKKEVAIRKQLGASVIKIIILLYKDIAFLILIAICLAVPISNWAINLWLDEFAYRTSIGAGIFIASGLSAFSIGFVSVLYHSLKAAFINPVEELKYE